MFNDLGITKMQSSRWQGLARVPTEEWTAFLSANEDNRELVSWTPFHSQTVTAPAAANFYRARIVKTTGP